MRESDTERPPYAHLVLRVDAGEMQSVWGGKVLKPLGSYLITVHSWSLERVLGAGREDRSSYWALESS